MTSGTLEPNVMETEMEIQSPIKFTNQHIIDQSQVYVKVVNNGPDGVRFDSRFYNR